MSSYLNTLDATADVDSFGALNKHNIYEKKVYKVKSFSARDSEALMTDANQWLAEMENSIKIINTNQSQSQNERTGYINIAYTILYWHYL